MTFPLMFGPPTLNAPTVHQFDIPLRIGNTSTAVSWILYGVTLSRPTATTLKVQLPEVYKYLVAYHHGRFPVAITSQVGYIVSADNLAVDGSITLTSVAGGAATAPANGDRFLLTLCVSTDAQIDAYTGSVA